MLNNGIYLLLSWEVDHWVLRNFMNMPILSCSMCCFSSHTPLCLVRQWGREIIWRKLCTAGWLMCERPIQERHSGCCVVWGSSLSGSNFLRLFSRWQSDRIDWYFVNSTTLWEVLFCYSFLKSYHLFVRYARLRSTHGRTSVWRPRCRSIWRFERSRRHGVESIWSTRCAGMSVWSARCWPLSSRCYCAGDGISRTECGGGGQYFAPF